MNSPDTLLLDLYACPIEPSRWTSVLDQLCRETGAHSAVLQVVRVTDTGVRVDCELVDTHTRRFHHPPGIDNPRLEKSRLQLGLGRVMRDYDLFGRDEPAARQLHNQLAALGLDRFAGLLQQVDQEAYLALALHRAKDQGRDFTAGQLARLSNLGPHFKQAFALGAHLRARTELDLRLRRYFDRLRCGLVVCDGQGRIQWLNHSAQALLAAGGALQVQDDRVRARSAAANTRLLHELQALGELAAIGNAGASRYLALGGDHAPLHLVMQALPAEQGGAGTVLLAISDAAAKTAIPLEAVTKLFGLTTAEARLLAGLVAGMTLEQYAAQRGVTIGTVRGQLKQVQAKTGASRQSDLIRLVLGSAAAQLIAPED